MWLLFYPNKKTVRELNRPWFSCLPSLGSFGITENQGQFVHCELLLSNKLVSGDVVYQAYGISPEKNDGLAYKETRTLDQLLSSEVISYLVKDPESNNSGLCYDRGYENTYEWYEKNLQRQYQNRSVSLFYHFFLCGKMKSSDKMHTAEFSSYCLQTAFILGGLLNKEPFYPQLYTIDSLYRIVNTKKSSAYCEEDTVQLLNRMKN